MLWHFVKDFPTFDDGVKGRSTWEVMKSDLGKTKQFKIGQNWQMDNRIFTVRFAAKGRAAEVGFVHDVVDEVMERVQIVQKALRERMPS